MLADTYTDDKERSRSMGIALGGIAFGVLSKYDIININEAINCLMADP